MADLSKYDPLFEAAGRKWGVDPDELRAIARVESGGLKDPEHAISPVGAQGIMQVMPEHTKGAEDPFDPAYNIDKGAEVLAGNYAYFTKHGVKPEHLQRASWAGYNRSPKHVLADYNAAGQDASVLDKGTDHDAYVSAVGSRYNAIKGTTQAAGDRTEETPSVASAGSITLKALPNGMVPFKDREGNVYTVPAEKAADEYQRGNDPVDTDAYAEQLKKEFLHKKYGTGIGNAAKAAGESLLDVGTFGAGTGALVASGVESPEEAKEHEESFPVVKGAATVGGFIGQHLIGVGEAADVARAAKLGGKALEGGEELAQAGKVLEAPKPTLPEFGAAPATEEVSDADIVGSRPANKQPPPFNPEREKLPSPGREAAQAYDAAQPKGAEAVRDAYADVRKTHGKDLADAVMEGEEGGAPEMADNAEVTNAGGMPKGDATPSAPPPPTEAAPEAEYTPPQPTMAEFKLPARPEGIQEPLPPEQTATLPLQEPTNDAINTVAPPGSAGAAPSAVAQPSTAPRAPTSGPLPTPGGPPIPPGAVPPPPPVPIPQAGALVGQAAAATARAAPKAFSAVDDGLHAALKSAGLAAAESVPWTVGNNFSQAEINREPINAERLFAGGIGNAMLSAGLGASFGLAAKGLRKLNLAFEDMASKIGPEERIKNWKGSLDNVRDGMRTFTKAVYDDGLKYARYQQELGNANEIVSGRAPKSFKDLMQQSDQLLSNISKQAGVGPHAAAVEIEDAWSKMFAATRTATTDAQVMEAADRLKRTLNDVYRKDLKGGGTVLEASAKQLERQWSKELESTATFGKAAEFQKTLNDAWHKMLLKDSAKSPIFQAFMRKGMIGVEGDRVFDERKLADFIRESTAGTPKGQAASELRSQILDEWLKANRDYAKVLREHVYEPLGKDHEIAGFHSFVGGDDAQIASTLRDMQEMTAQQKKTFLTHVLGSHSFRFGAAFALMAAGVPHAFLATWGVSALLRHFMGASGVSRAIAEHGARFTNVLTGMVDDVFKAGSLGAGAVGVFSKLQPTHEPVSAKERHEQAAETAAQVVKLANDPQLPQKLAASTGLLNNVAPTQGVQLQTQAMKAIQYLAAQAPKDPLQPSPLNKIPYRPGHAETARWENIVEVVHDPTVLLRDLKGGSLTHEQVATAEAVYPELLGQMRQLVQERLPEQGKNLTLQQQRALAVLLGHPVDWSTQPDAAPFLQKVFALPPPGQGDMSKGGAANVKKPRAPNSAKQATMLADQVQSGLQSALTKV